MGALLFPAALPAGMLGPHALLPLFFLLIFLAGLDLFFAPLFPLFFS